MPLACFVLYYLHVCTCCALYELARDMCYCPGFLRCCCSCLIVQPCIVACMSSPVCLD
jgi:hypothetical protein